MRNLKGNKKRKEVKRMNKLQIFENENLGKIRTQVINNEPYFCLKDICEILSLSTPSKVKLRLNPKGMTEIHTLTNGGIQMMNFINESNLYKCIFRSNKKEAEEFTDWVTEDVLPTIRKTGIYANQKLLLTPSEMRLKIRYYDSKSKVFNSINRLLNNDHMTEELRNALTGNIKDILSNDDNLIQTRAQQDNEEWNRNDLTDKLNINAKNVNGRTKRVFVN